MEKADVENSVENVYNFVYLKLLYYLRKPQQRKPFRPLPEKTSTIVPVSRKFHRNFALIAFSALSGFDGLAGQICRFRCKNTNSNHTEFKTAE